MKILTLLFLLISVTASLSEITFEGDSTLDWESRTVIKKILAGRIPSGVHEVNFVTYDGTCVVHKVRVRADASEKRLLTYEQNRFWAFLYFYLERDLYITVVNEQPELYYELVTSTDLSLWTSSRVHLKGISVFKIVRNRKESREFFKFAEKESPFN